MMASTHVAAGTLAIAGLAHLTNTSGPVAGYLYAAGALGALLPDIDHPSSWLGRRLWFISIPLSGLVGHRGVTHSLAAVVAVLAAFWYATAQMTINHASLIFMGLATGYLSHLLCDWLSNSGVPLLWPIKRRYRAPMTLATGSAVERMLGFAVSAACVWAIAT